MSGVMHKAFMNVTNEDKLFNAIKSYADDFRSSSWNMFFDIPFEKEKEYYNKIMSCFELKHYENPSHSDYLEIFNSSYHNKIRVINDDKLIIPLLLSVKVGLNVEDDDSIRNKIRDLSLKIIFCKLWNHLCILNYDPDPDTKRPTFTNHKNHVSNPKHLLSKYKNQIELFEEYYIPVLIKKYKYQCISYPDMGISTLINMFKSMWLRTNQLFK